MRQTHNLINSTYSKPNFTSGSQQLLSNFYIEVIPQTAAGSRPTFRALPTPGCSLWLNTSGSQVRAMLEHKGNIYSVIDNTLYKISNVSGLPSSSSLGTLTTSSGKVIIDAIDDEIVVCDVSGGTVWSYKVTAATYAQVSAAQFTVGGVQTPVISVVGYAGYFLYLCKNSKTIYYSNLNDGRTVQALNFFQTNSFYDNTVAMTRSENYIYFMSNVATEVWQLSGQPTIPFIRASGGIIQYGVWEKYTYAVTQDNVYFIACDTSGPLGLGVMNGPNAQVNPQPDLISKLNSYKNIDNAFSFIENFNGHALFNISIPSAFISYGITWGIDTTTGAVIQRASYRSPAIPSDIYLANCSCYLTAYGANLFLIGDYYSGNIYQQSVNTYTDNGNYISRQIITPHITDRDTIFGTYNLQINIEPGQELVSGQGSNPIVMFSYSKDYGHTWSQEIQLQASPITSGLYRIRLSSLGSARVLTMKFIMTDPINWIINSATFEIEREEPTYGRMMGLE